MDNGTNRKKGVAISAGETLGGLSNGVIRSGFFFAISRCFKEHGWLSGHATSRTERSKVFGGVQQRRFLGIRQQNSSGVRILSLRPFLSQQERKDIALFHPGKIKQTNPMTSSLKGVQRCFRLSAQSTLKFGFRLAEWVREINLDFEVRRSLKLVDLGLYVCKFPNF